MKVLVTGATGFIGRHAVRALTEAGHEVVCLVRETSNRAPLATHAPRFAVGDIGRPETLGPIAEVDAVLHLASLLKMPWKPAFQTVNAAGTGHVAHACAEASSPPTLVVVSSLAAGGPSAEHPRREADGAAPASIYGRVKLDAEAAALAVADRAPVTVVRPPLVFGEGDTTALPLFRGVAKGWHLVPGGPDRRVSFVHATDLALALVTAIERGERADGEVGRGVYYVADPARPTFAEFGAMVGEALDRPPRILRVPAPLLWCAALATEVVGRLRDRPAFFNLDKYREARAGSWICDPAKAMEQLDFAPVDPLERLRQTATWYQAQGWL